MDRPFLVGLPARSRLFPLTSRRVARLSGRGCFRVGKIRSAGDEKKRKKKKRERGKRFVIPPERVVVGARIRRFNSDRNHGTLIQRFGGGKEGGLLNRVLWAELHQRRIAHYFLGNRGISLGFRTRWTPIGRWSACGGCGREIDDADENDVVVVIIRQRVLTRISCGPSRGRILTPRGEKRATERFWWSYGQHSSLVRVELFKIV